MVLGHGLVLQVSFFQLVLHGAGASAELFDDMQVCHFDLVVPPDDDIVVCCARDVIVLGVFVDDWSVVQEPFGKFFVAST